VSRKPVPESLWHRQFGVFDEYTNTVLEKGYYMSLRRHFLIKNWRRWRREGWSWMVLRM